MKTLIPQIDPAKLRAARKSAGLSQESMGELLGVGKSQISNIETGYSQLSADDLLIWCRACNVSTADLSTPAPPGAFYSRKKVQLSSL